MESPRDKAPAAASDNNLRAADKKENSRFGQDQAALGAVNFWLHGGLGGCRK
jgi:hypothetical protein